MNIDERLQALTESVELMAAMHRDTEVRLEARFEALTQTVGTLAQVVRRNEERSGQFMDTMNRVARILEAHDIAIDDLNRPTG